MAQALEPLCRGAQGVEVLAEREACVVLTDADMLVAVELQIARASDTKEMRAHAGRTSLTGIHDTPISFAMNQVALRVSQG